MREKEIYKIIALTLSNILKDNNATLLANLIDQSGRIILREDALKEILSIIYNVDKIKIQIISTPSENGCCLNSCCNPIHEITNIIINNNDINKNEINENINIFSISVEKVLVL